MAQQVALRRAQVQDEASGRAVFEEVDPKSLLDQPPPKDVVKPPALVSSAVNSSFATNDYPGRHHRGSEVLTTAVTGLPGESFWNTTLPRLHPSNLRLVSMPPPLAPAHHPAAPPPPVFPSFPLPYTQASYADPHRTPAGHPSFALPPAPPASYVLPAAPAAPHPALSLATPLYEPPSVVAKHPPPPSLASLVTPAALYDTSAVVAASTSSGGGGGRITPELVAGSPVALDYSSQAALGEEYIDVQGTATAGHS